MRLILRALGDPALEQILLRAGEFLVRVRRRHEVIGVLGEDAFDELARVRLAGDESLGGDGGLAHIEAELGLALLLVRAVAVKAVVGKNRPDVAVVIDLLGGRGGSGGSGGNGPDDG